jgi:DNA-binding beta-propeller fold protein YncE
MAGSHPPTVVYTPVFVPGNASQVSDMVVSHDEKTVYVMDAESDDVTAVKSDGTVAAILPAKCGDSARLWKPSKGPFVYHFGKSAVTVIDSAENKVAKEIPIERGFAAMRMSQRNEFYLCDRVSCDVWDAVTAASVAKMDRQGLSARLAHADEPAEDAGAPDAADPAKAEPAQTEPAETASAAEPAKP